MNAIPNNKKVAIIHDSFTQFGGAERVLFYLIKMFPKADIYTSLINDKFQKEIRKKSKGKLYFSKLSKFSLAIKYPSSFKPYFFHYYWESLNLNKYDLVISSSHSFCAHFVKVKNNHISYLHTTPRFLHNEFNEISCLKKPLIRQITEPYFSFLRKKNYAKMKKIDVLLSNSINVQKRIKKYYNSKSKVIYPPVRLAEIKTSQKITKTENYLFFSRLVKQKGIELVIKSFNINHKPLLVIGTSNQEKTWRKLANNNIKFLGFVPDEKLSSIFERSKALIYAAINEDFGMIPVEAMSYGLPIIAYKDGGVKETVIDNKTGLFFENYNIRSLNQAVERFEKLTFDASDCIKQSQNFSEDRFRKNFIAEIKKLISD